MKAIRFRKAANQDLSPDYFFFFLAGCAMQRGDQDSHLQW